MNSKNNILLGLDADNKKGLSDNKLDYSGLKVFKPAIYQFMEDVIKILNLPA